MRNYTPFLVYKWKIEYMLTNKKTVRKLQRGMVIVGIMVGIVILKVTGRI